MITTGEVAPTDGVSLMGEPFRPIREIPELARHFLPSTTAVTNRFTGPGVPDYQALIDETPMPRVLAHLRSRRESGALFVQRNTQSNSVRKEIYIEHGKLHHVASSDRNELLGEYLVRRGRVSRADLERALAGLHKSSLQLGDLLIEMGLVGAVDLFRALRDQGATAWPRSARGTRGAPPCTAAPPRPAWTSRSISTSLTRSWPES